MSAFWFSVRSSILTLPVGSGPVMRNIMLPAESAASKYHCTYSSLQTQNTVQTDAAG